MRKIYNFILAAALFVISGCSGSPSQSAEAEPENTPAAAETAEAEQSQTTAEPEAPAESEEGNEDSVLNEETVTRILEVYASVLNEEFGAEVNWGEASFSDDIARYYEVSNFRSKDEVTEYLSRYIDASLISSSLIEQDFLEKDGRLYLVRGGRGYGYYGIDPSSWEWVGDRVARVQFTILGDAEEGALAEVTFKDDGGVWKLATYTQPENY